MLLTLEATIVLLSTGGWDQRDVSPCTMALHSTHIRIQGPSSLSFMKSEIERNPLQRSLYVKFLCGGQFLPLGNIKVLTIILKIKPSHGNTYVWSLGQLSLYTSLTFYPECTVSRLKARLIGG